VQLLEKLDLPVLVVQGRRDRTVWPGRTRRALALLPAQPRYLEVEAGHDLFDASLPAWVELEQAVLAFAREIEEQSAAVNEAERRSV
jgi:pimeloyl-ACP methyl ester carboxylesterase